MKKFTTLLLTIVCIVMLVGCMVACTQTTYQLNSDNFNSIVELNGTLTLGGLNVKITTGEDVRTLPVTQDMINQELSDLDTSSVGEKKIVIEFQEQTFEVTFTVKYKVEFVVDNNVVETQFVLNSSEIQLPLDPTKQGYTFVYWMDANGNEANFSAIENNVRFQAKFLKNAVMQTGTIYTWEDSGEIDYSQDMQDDCTYSVSLKDDEQQSVLSVSLDEQNQKIAYTFLDTSFVGDVVVVFKAAKEGVVVGEREHTIKRYNKPTATIGSNDINVLDLSTYTSLSIVINSDLAYAFEDPTSNNDNVVLMVAGDLVIVRADKAGISKISLTVYNQYNPGEHVEFEKTVIVKPQDFSITQIAENINYGIEGIRTIGRTDADGSLSTFEISYSLGNLNDVDDTFLDNVSWHSNNTVATINSNGIITLQEGTGAHLVTFVATFSYHGVELSSTPYTLRCVLDGVNVYSYEDLYNATTSNQVVVLQANIDEDFGKIDGQLDYTKFVEINSTYDTTYYNNIERLEQAKIKVLLQFKNDVYGNGKIINAHNLTMGTLDSTLSPTENTIFRGPLNFVSMTTSESSAISVKGQDNVCFAVYENVTLNNVDFRGCTLEADEEGNIDLTDLNLVGTTVEVFGDNVNFEYCRISNGRTVMRIFGDSQDKTKAIHVNIKNSVLSNGREFIIRMGTNLFVDGTYENPTPRIGDDTLSFPKQLQYEEMSQSQKANYDQTYIKTFVTIKNSVLKDAGIFSIGIDSHFSGAMLADGSQYGAGTFYESFIANWKNLAKTSYGAKLTFEGDVRIYDWKPLNSVDSSTLIECLDETYAQLLRFDVKELVGAVAEQEKFKNIICTVNNEKYVHGGVAFFGGGKNYGVFETENYSFHAFQGYQVTLSEIDRELLEAAAGREAFYFMLHDNTGTFLPNHQKDLLASSDAYNNIYIFD